jgi:uncharacterized iron-regulated protein
MRTAASLLPLLAFVAAVAAPARAAEDCIPVGAWIAPATGERRDDALFALSRRAVVLLGESHEDAEHHRCQLHSIAALLNQRPDLVLGFEMFPRRVQPVLDRWSRGELSEAEFLREVGWSEIWGTEPGLYLPLFHFARMHRVPMLALNVSRSTVRAVSTRGLDGLSPDERERVGNPAPVSVEYRERLFEVYKQHQTGGETPIADSDGFQRFVQAQTFWDRAMAEAITAAHRRGRRPLVVGIVGQGHVEYGDGVARQLAALGIDDVATALPWPAAGDCRKPDRRVADVVFGVAPVAEPRTTPPRLGVVVSAVDGGVKVDRIVPQSIAESAGLVVGDVILQAAGSALRQPGDLVAVVRRQAPGTLLPLSVRRGEQSQDLVARFPVEP